MRVLIDTSVLARMASGPQDPQYELAEGALAVGQHGQQPVVVPQVLYEFWAVVTRPRADNGLGLSTEQAAAELARLGPPLFGLLRDERAILAHWRRLVRSYGVQGKTTHDARLVAAMIRHELKTVLTFNMGHFTRFHEISAISPQDVVASGSLS